VTSVRRGTTACVAVLVDPEALAASSDARVPSPRGGSNGDASADANGAGSVHGAGGVHGVGGAGGMHGGDSVGAGAGVPGGGVPGVEAARVLRAAGWRVVTVRTAAQLAAAWGVVSEPDGFDIDYARGNGGGGAA
ncbi:hypothetical protein AB0J52_36265, partial [Spirillospora sp. NPDC049652]